MAQGIAIALVVATILFLLIDYARGKVKHYRQAKAKAVVEQKIQQADTRSMERSVDEKLEEMETLKGLSGKFSSAMGMQVRASMASPPEAQKKKLSDSQIVKDMAAKNAEIERLAGTRPVI